MPHPIERYRTNPVPKLHNAMVACEQYDRRAYNKLKRIQHDYGWKWWDGPTKNRDTKSWKSATKRRHQYRIVEM